MPGMAELLILLVMGGLVAGIVLLIIWLVRRNKSK